MSRPITTADVLPFEWGDYTYTAKQDLLIECKPSPHLPEYMLANCGDFRWSGCYADKEGRWHEIQDFRRTIHNRCQHWLMADDSVLTPEGLCFKRQLNELFTVTKL